MITRFRRKWIRLKEARPGRRFQNHYRRVHRGRTGAERTPRIGRLILALVLFAVALCLFVFPLVYVPFLVASAALLASESPRFARILDRGEVWSRDEWTTIQRRLGVSGDVMRMGMLALGLILTGCVCYTTFMR